MAITLYLAITAAELSGVTQPPKHPAWMACHFSCYGTGLSNLPQTFPKGGMIIVNDRTPVHGHDPSMILEQLMQLIEVFDPWGFLLDFQRPNNEITAQITRLLTQELPRPVGVTAQYAGDLTCPVFLSPPPLHAPWKEYLLSWKDREIWLEAAIESEEFSITKAQRTVTPLSVESLDEPVFWEETLQSSYHIETEETGIKFQFLRGRTELEKLLEASESLGVSLAIGLYQQLGNVVFP